LIMHNGGDICACRLKEVPLEDIFARVIQMGEKARK